VTRAGRPVRVTATGVAFDSGLDQDLVLVGARLQAGSAAATAVIREGDASGAVVVELGAPAGQTDECRIPVVFRRALYVTLSGSGASCVVYV
jgi:hypothetical protein